MNFNGFCSMKFLIGLIVSFSTFILLDEITFSKNVEGIVNKYRISIKENQNTTKINREKTGGDFDVLSIAGIRG